ncbi:MAG: hypothetical protein IJY24_04940 [Clostridia bacterium]|nr:hypothetical protein [Clostridia bacterium]
MNISVTTVHDYDRILDFQIYHNLTRKFFWVLMGIVLFFASFAFFTNMYMGTLETVDYVCFVGAILLVVFYLLLIFVFPRFSIKSSYFYMQEETMTFTEENMSFTSVCRGSSSSGVVAYPTITRVLRTKKSYCFYNSALTAYIVDREGIYSQIDQRAFEEFLLRTLGKDKIKFSIK